jgi:hypothetical protein
MSDNKNSMMSDLIDLISKLSSEQAAEVSTYNRWLKCWELAKAGKLAEAEAVLKKTPLVSDDESSIERFMSLSLGSFTPPDKGRTKPGSSHSFENCQAVLVYSSLSVKKQKLNLKLSKRI